MRFVKTHITIRDHLVGTDLQRGCVKMNHFDAAPFRYPHAVVGTTQSLNEKSELIKTEGERGKMVYMLGEKYKKQNDIIAKALNIGLKALEENGEL